MSEAPPAGRLPRPLHPVPRDLRGLLATVPELRAEGPVALQVTGCTHDSTAVQPGDLFVGLAGAKAHGARFAAAAAGAGAVAVLTDEEGAAPARASGLPVLVAPAPRALLGPVASWVHGDAWRSLLLLGVTGTNGKTTTSYLLEAGLRGAGHVTGLVGTVETKLAGDSYRSARTTPEATDLHALFAAMVERGVSAVAMEVSSHALAVGRVDGFQQTVAGFTNLSQDHLELHGSMASYFAAKASLFTPAHARSGVVTVDDSYGRQLAAGASIPVRTLSAQQPADWSVTDLSPGSAGTTFTLSGPSGSLPVRTALLGSYNAANAALALAMLTEAGVDPAAAARGVAALPGLPGRLERVESGQPFLAAVDYAHTPDAVTHLLAAVRQITSGRVLVVLGCGGDRDRGKRPLMARAAAEGADLVVLTSDNPRSEDPLAILAEMAPGAPDAVVEPDRRAAIRYAVEHAGPGDSVVVAGKGHETGQEANGTTVPFDDRLVLREALTAGARG